MKKVERHGVTIYLKVDGYIFRGSNSVIFIFASLLKRTLLLKERICCIINPTLIGFEETFSYWSVQFFFWSPSVGNMTLVSFIKTMESYKVSLVSIIGKLHVILVSLVKTTQSYNVC